MFRRILLTLLAGVMLLSVVACSQGTTNDPTQAPTISVTEPAETDEAATTQAPTATVKPTQSATQTPTQQPTQQPTKQPTKQPTEQPTKQPTEQPTKQPTEQPTKQPTEQPTVAPTQQPVAGGTLYQLTSTDVMMSYVIQTANNKVIILDGGLAENKYDLINLAKEITGQAVPEIEAWFFTHAHSDHVNAFSSLINTTTTKNALNVKKLYYNIPSREYVEKYEPKALNTYDSFALALQMFPFTKREIVEQGDVFFIDGIKIEVLIVPGEFDKPTSGAVVNDTSVIYRVTIGGQRILFLGDAHTQTGRLYYNTYRNDLKADVVQMAHHGSQGIPRSIYKAIAPKVCLWPSSQYMWDPANQGSDKLETVDLHRYMCDTVGVKHHYIARDGVQKLVFPLNID